MTPSLVRNAVDRALQERDIEEGNAKLSRQVNVRVHSGIYALLERVALEVGKSPTAVAQMLLVSSVVEAADELGFDINVELDSQELLFVYPWMFTVTDIKPIHPEEVAE